MNEAEWGYIKLGRDSMVEFLRNPFSWSRALSSKSSLEITQPVIQGVENENSRCKCEES